MQPLLYLLLLSLLGLTLGLALSQLVTNWLRPPAVRLSPTLTTLLVLIIITHLLTLSYIIQRA